MIDAAGDAFKRPLGLDTEKAIHQGNEGSEVSMLVKTRIGVLLLLVVIDNI